jgi:hypothetical protein
VTPGFIFTVDGCPIMFGTAGLSGITSTDSNWAIASTATLVAGMLRDPDVEWPEMMQPLRGKLDVGGITLLVEDRIADGSIAAVPAGKRCITYLGTRSVIPGSQITATVLAGATTIPVTDAARCGSVPGVVYLEQEAIRVASVVGNVLTGCTRGYYGTRAVQHNFAPARTAPMVFSAFDTFYRKRAILWRVGRDGVAVVWWIGYCTHAPEQQSTLLWKFQLDHFTKVNARIPVGPPRTTAYVRGVMADGLGIGTKTVGAGFFVWDGSGARASYGDLVVYGSMFDALQNAAAKIGTPTAGTIVGRTAYINGGRATAKVATTGSSTLAVALHIGTQESVVQSAETADPRTAEAAVDNVPNVLCVIRVGSGLTYVAVDRVDGFPSSWSIAATPETDGSQTLVSPMLLGDIDDETRMQFLVASHTASNVSMIPAQGASVLGVPRFQPRRPYARATPPMTTFRGGDRYVIEQPLALRLAYRVLSNHWVYALQRGTVEDPTLNTGIDSRQYDWTDANRILALTEERSSRREWYLDGSQTFDQLQAPSCLLGGCAPGLRAGRQTIVPMQPPLPTDPVVATITQPDLATGILPVSGVFEDGVINTARLKSEFVDLTVVDDLSIARFLASETAQIDLSDSLPVAAGGDDPIALSLTVMRRFIGVWSIPHRYVRVTLKPSWIGRLTHGDTVSVTLRGIPDGLGGMGVTDQRAQVFGLSKSTRKDANQTVWLLVYSHQQLAGYSPAVRVASLVGSTITVATAYLNAVATDYAGSNLAGYRGTASDGGTSFWAAGYKGQLFQEDSATPLTENVTVLSVNPATKQIVLTGAPAGGWGAILSGGGLVKLRFARYTTAGLAAAQKQYAYIGAESPGVIDSTADLNQRFSP